MPKRLTSTIIYRTKKTQQRASNKGKYLKIQRPTLKEYELAWLTR